MTDRSGNFVVEVQRFIEKAKIAPDIALQKISIDLFRSIVMKTPVDTGALRANWQASNGEPLSGVVEEVDPTGSATLQKATAVLGRAKAGTPVYFTNNLPYAAVVEYGLYPNPPMRGTRVPAGTFRYGVKGPGWAVRTIKGFSKQAPKGVVRVAVQEMSAKLSKAFK